MKTLIKRIMPVLLAIVTILTVASFNTASAKGYNCTNSKLQKLINQPGIGNAAGLKQLGIHRNGGESRQGIDLVEHHPVLVVRHEEVHPA